MEHRRAKCSQFRRYAVSFGLNPRGVVAQGLKPGWGLPIRSWGEQTLISVQKSLCELDRCEELRQATTECYELALQSVAQYAVELEASNVEQFHKRVAA